MLMKVVRKVPENRFRLALKQADNNFCLLNFYGLALAKPLSCRVSCKDRVYIETTSKAFVPFVIVKILLSNTCD